MATKDEVVRSELLRIRAKYGKVTKQLLFKESKSKRAPCHKFFEWNMRKGWEKYNLDIAADLIRTYMIVIVTDRSRRQYIPMSVRDPQAPPNQSGNILLFDRERINRNDAERVMLAELGRCEAAIERARLVTRFLDSKYPGLSARLENLLTGVIDLRDRLEAAE